MIFSFVDGFSSNPVRIIVYLVLKFDAILSNRVRRLLHVFSKSEDDP